MRLSQRWYWRIGVVAMAAAVFSHSRSAIGQESGLQKFQIELSTALLGRPGPMPDGSRGMFVGIAIVPPGEAWSPVVGEDESTERTPWGTSTLALQFNYPLEVRGGISNFRRQQRLEAIWQRLLAGSVPATALPSTVLNSVLFRRTDRIDEARGIEQMRQPSEFYLRYQEYHSAWRVLETAQAGDAWRFHPRFTAFSSLDAAKAQIADEWVLFGYKAQVKAAMQEFDNAQLPGVWRSWLAANASFRANTVDTVPGVPAGRTWLFPPETEWHNMRSWSNVIFHNDDGSKIGCQVSRVKVHRPWLDLLLVQDPRFSLDKASGLGVLSDGATPTNDTFAKGDLANLVEDLVLVRRFQGAKAGHPLARFEHAEAINLIAYFARSLPKIGVQE